MSRKPCELGALAHTDLMRTPYRDPALRAAQQAREAQAWKEAMALMPDVDTDHLGSEGLDYLLLRADLLRRRGDVDRSEALYRRAMHAVSLQHDEMAVIWSGLGDIAHLRGDFAAGIRLALAAESVPMTDQQVAFGVYLTSAHILTHLDLDGALERFAWMTSVFPPQRTAAWADFQLQRADALLCAGQLEDATAGMLEAHRLAASVGATVTLADAKRRLPLLRMLLGQVEHALKGMADLQVAAELYRAAGDRGDVYLHTEAGEVQRALGRPTEAQIAFRAGLRGARQLGDANRIAHNCLGLFELSRQAGAPDLDLWQEAYEHYRQLGSDWGVVHACLARALAQPQHRDRWLDRAESMLDHSGQAAFERERALVRRYRQVPLGHLAAEPHLMNWP